VEERSAGIVSGHFLGRFGAGVAKRTWKLSFLFVVDGDKEEAMLQSSRSQVVCPECKTAQERYGQKRCFKCNARMPVMFSSNDELADIAQRMKSIKTRVPRYFGGYI
jgi:hypothetical protein